MPHEGARAQSGKQSRIEAKGLILVDGTSGCEILGWKLLLKFKGWARDPRVTPCWELCEERLEGKKRWCQHDRRGRENWRERDERSRRNTVLLPFRKEPLQSLPLSRETHTGEASSANGIARVCVSHLFVPFARPYLLGGAANSSKDCLISVVDPFRRL